MWQIDVFLKKKPIRVLKRRKIGAYILKDYYPKELFLVHHLMLF